jgi:hypothetical protein
MNLRLLANVFAMFFGFVGLALVITAIRIFPSRPVGAIVVCVAGIANVSYAFRLGFQAAQRKFPAWIRDLPLSIFR